MTYFSAFLRCPRPFVAGSLLLAAALPACTSADQTRSEPATRSEATETSATITSKLEADALVAGQALFAQRCAVCHGADGKLGLNGAHDLTRSNLTTTGRVYMVTNGLGKMPAFKNQLTEAEIEQVVAYSLTLR